MEIAARAGVVAGTTMIAIGLRVQGRGTGGPKKTEVDQGNINPTEIEAGNIKPTEVEAGNANLTSRNTETRGMGEAEATAKDATVNKLRRIFTKVWGEHH